MAAGPEPSGRSHSRVIVLFNDVNKSLVKLKTVGASGTARKR